MIFLVCAGLLCSTTPLFGISEPLHYRYDFGIKSSDKDNFTGVLPAYTYSDDSGYGFVSTVPVQLVGEGEMDAVTALRPFYFQQRIPEGNYRVTVTLGAKAFAGITTIKSENRRLMVYQETTAPGHLKEVSFNVHIRSPQLADGNEVRRKPREFQYLSWDDKLTLEFGGSHPCIAAVEIEEIQDIPVVFLCGNSTVVDQHKEPWGSWGQIFPLFFDDQVVVANHAESGETLKSFIGERRLQKIEEQIKPGDYLFIEFAHNDQKPGNNHVDPFGSYQQYVMKFVTMARNHGATPVLVTSMNRRVFDDNGKIVNTLGDYPTALRELSNQESIQLIDLNSMSKILFESMGPEASKLAFVHIPASTFEDQPEAIADDTHFSTYGAWQLAKCVVVALWQSDLALRKHLRYDLDFNPDFPDDIESWNWPVSPLDELDEFDEIIHSE